MRLHRVLAGAAAAAFGCALAETVLVTTAGARVLNRSARGLVTLD